MNNKSFTSASMQELVVLARRHEDLLHQIQALEAKIVHLCGAQPPRAGGARKGRPPKGEHPPAKRGRKGNHGQKPGALKDRILDILENCGESGITVSEIASKLDVPKANVHVWFSTTGKRLGEVKKIEPGRFRFQGPKKK